MLASSSPAAKSRSAREGFFSKLVRHRSACEYSLWSSQPGTGWLRSKQALDDKGIWVGTCHIHAELWGGQLIAPSGPHWAPRKDTRLICDVRSRASEDLPHDSDWCVWVAGNCNLILVNKSCSSLFILMFLLTFNHFEFCGSKRSYVRGFGGSLKMLQALQFSIPFQQSPQDVYSNMWHPLEVYNLKGAPAGLVYFKSELQMSNIVQKVCNAGIITSLQQHVCWVTASSITTFTEKSRLLALILAITQSPKSSHLPWHFFDLERVWPK